MCGKKTRQLVGKLITSGFRPGFLESPTTPLDLKILSPRGIINLDMGRVGLGIVAALEITSCQKGSDPIPVNQTGKVENEDGILEEEYAIATRHKPNKTYRNDHNGKCVTKKRIESRRQGCKFEISASNFGDDNNNKMGSKGFEYLSSCYLCNKRLHGSDIYMYRGEKAFCSPECRGWQIGVDERREKYCSSESSTSSSSCHPTRPTVATGIFAI